MGKDRSIVEVAGLIAGGGGLLVLLGGWGLGLQPLLSIVPHGATMSPPTSLCFGVLGLALLAATRGARKWAGGLALVTLLVALTSGNRELMSLEWVRTLFAHGVFRAAPRGFMAPATATGFVLVASSLFLSDMRRLRPAAAQALAILAGLLSLMALIGYLYGLEGLFGLHAYRQVALPTALLMLVASAGALFVRSEAGLPALLLRSGLGGQLARRLMSTFVLLPIAVGWLTLLGSNAGWYSTSFRLVLMVTTHLATTCAVIWRSILVIDRKEAERQKALEELEARAAALDRANRELREADRYKDEFLSVISHELRTPLNFITGFGSLLQDEVPGPLNAQQHAFMDKLMGGAERMLYQVNNLLDMSRVQAGELSVRPAPTDYAPLVAEVLDQLRPLADARGIRLQHDLPDLPLILLDAHRVMQVLTNLVDNAIKFSPEGAAIIVRARRQEGCLLTEVQDQGPGISAGDQDRLFKRFGQLDMSSTREAGGTGLGLAIAKAIVELHDGSIGVRSTPGEGSTFWFSLPLAETPRLEGAPQ